MIASSWQPTDEQKEAVIKFLEKGVKENAPEKVEKVDTDLLVGLSTLLMWLKS